MKLKKSKVRPTKRNEIKQNVTLKIFSENYEATLHANLPAVQLIATNESIQAVNPQIKTKISNFIKFHQNHYFQGQNVLSKQEIIT